MYSGANAALPGSRVRKAAKPKKPCKYGERVAGRCPKKAKTLRAALNRDVRKGSTRATKGYLERESEKVVSRAAHKGLEVGATRAAAKYAAAKSAGKLGASVATLGAGTLGYVALAGIASFAITTALLNYLNDRKVAKQDKAFELGQAYRKARLEAESQNGRALTKEQQKILADEFKKNLKEHTDLTTSDLSSLR